MSLTGAEETRGTVQKITKAVVKRRVIVVGNPGCGKSFVMNEITGGKHFESGASIGHGLTRRKKVVTVGEIDYADTPGLADMERGHECAEQISSAVNEGWRLRQHVVILFIVTLSCGGQPRQEDLQTMASVRDALRICEFDGESDVADAVIVNKCDGAVIVNISDGGGGGVMKEQLFNVFETRRLLMLPFVDENEDGERTLKREDLERVTEFVNGIKGVKLDERVTVVYKDRVSELRRSREMRVAVVQMRVALLKARRDRARTGVIYVVVSVGFVISVLHLMRIVSNKT